MNETIYNSPELINSDSSTLSAGISPLNSTPQIKARINSSLFQHFHTTFAATWLPIWGALVIVGLYMHYLVLRMSRRDEALLNCLLPDFALNFLVGGPAMYILAAIIILLPDPANEILGIWFCHMVSILGYVWLFRVWLFSFLVAILRYLYVVHNEKIREYGLARLERRIRILYWLYPQGLWFFILLLEQIMSQRFWPTAATDGLSNLRLQLTGGIRLNKSSAFTGIMGLPTVLPSMV